MLLDALDEARSSQFAASLLLFPALTLFMYEHSIFVG